MADHFPNSRQPPRRCSRPACAAFAGFTLVELLAVVGILGVLIALIVPAVSKAMLQAKVLRCASNLRGVGVAIHTYATQYDGCIPYGPPALPLSPINLYPSTGNVTSLIYEADGTPVGMGLMIGRQLDPIPRQLFCPATDQPQQSDIELSMIGHYQVQCDYFYRHGSGSNLYAPAGDSHINLADLGKNSRGLPIRALALDINFLCPSGMGMFGIFNRSNHLKRSVNILFSDGHVQTVENQNGRYIVDAHNDIEDGFAKILAVFEQADSE